MKKKDYFPEISEMVSKITSPNKSELLEAVYNGMFHALRLYYREGGLDEATSDLNIRREIEGVKRILNERISELDTDPGVMVAFPDDQFSSDALIDLHFLMKLVTKSN